MEKDNGSNKWNETGCFVYQFIGPVGVRSSPTTDENCRTEQSFSEGELVAIDLVRHSRTKPTDITKKDGPFLRLADGSGWLFERKKGDLLMKRVPVQTSLWTIYADNYPVGIHLRNHPIDLLHKFTVTDLLFKPNVSILPMQKIYCDRKVVADNGVAFYRVQGIDNAWVFDKRIIDGEEDHFMLLPESKVRTGLFAYQILDHVAVRFATQVSKKCKTSLIVHPGDIVVGDVLRESPFQANNGPFLRLTDGSGWLFEYKYDDQLMQEIHIETGRWWFTVFSPAGIQLMKQPIMGSNNLFSDRYAKNDEVVCDRMIAAPSGINFYRVEGTDGWLFDTYNGLVMMNLTSVGPKQSQAGLAGWSVDYVRGMATAIESIQEIDFNDQSRVISYRHDDKILINVYYTTRTVGTALVDEKQGKTQLFRKDCSGIELAEILKNPRIHTGQGYQKKATPIDSSDTSVGSAGFEIGVEEELRASVLECDEEMERLSERRSALFKSIVVHSVKRRIYGNRMNERRVRHEQFLEEERRIAMTCQHCIREFDSSSALKNHVCETQGIIACHKCGKSFKSRNALNRHRDASGHY